MEVGSVAVEHDAVEPGPTAAIAAGVDREPLTHGWIAGRRPAVGSARAGAAPLERAVEDQVPPVRAAGCRDTEEDDRGEDRAPHESLESSVPADGAERPCGTVYPLIVVACPARVDPSAAPEPIDKGPGVVFLTF